MDSNTAGNFWEGNSENWTKWVRKGYDICRDQINTPGFLRILEGIDLTNLSGLDVGCGEGQNTRTIATVKGAKMKAVDISPNFIKHCIEKEQEEPLGIEFSVVNAEKLDQAFPAESFDFATSFMCMMDLPDQLAAFRGIFSVLKPGGFFQFSILHPCFNTPYRVIHKTEERVSYEVGDYFTREEGTLERWVFGCAQRENPDAELLTVPRFHRTLTEWFDMLTTAGFVIERFYEPPVSQESYAKYPSLRFNLSISLFLIIRVRKPNNNTNNSGTITSSK